MAFPKWNPSQHPRDGNGRFRRKGSVGVRVSTRSISVTAGQRIPLVPGKVNLFVGGLVRLENASRAKGPVQRGFDRLTDRAINLVPDGGLRNIAKGLAGEGSVRRGSTLITGSTGLRSTPTIRATRSSSGSVQTGNKTRSPNRKPRAPRQPRARRVA